MVGSNGVNFCCIDCWEYSWSHTQVSIGLEDEAPAALVHSAQCRDRQSQRFGVTLEDEPAEGWIMSVRGGVR